jgi:hypothetical protein
MFIYKQCGKVHRFPEVLEDISPVHIHLKKMADFGLEACLPNSKAVVCILTTLLQDLLQCEKNLCISLNSTSLTHDEHLLK